MDFMEIPPYLFIFFYSITEFSPKYNAGRRNKMEIDGVMFL